MYTRRARRPSRKYSVLPILLIPALLSLSFPPPLRAAEAQLASQGVETTRFSFRGRFAEAFFSNLDEGGCVVTSVGIFAVDGRTKEKGRPERGSTASITVTKLDTCNGLELMSAEGTFGFGNGDLGESLRIDPQLRSATLVAPFQVVDSLSGSFIDLNVTVSWTATSAPFRVKEQFHIRQPGFRVISKFEGNFRRAAATAVVWDGSTNLTARATTFGDLSSVKQGEVVVLR
jgi:hypothetical protein